MKAEFKFLCYTHQACPDVKAELGMMGFKKIRDAPTGAPFDIYANMELVDRRHENEVVERLVKQFKEKINTIQIATQ